MTVTPTRKVQSWVAGMLRLWLRSAHGRLSVSGFQVLGLGFRP